MLPTVGKIINKPSICGSYIDGFLRTEPYKTLFALSTKSLITILMKKWYLNNNGGTYKKRM